MTIRILFINVFVCLRVGLSCAYSQDTTTANQLIFFASQKQKGIYRTFSEFRNNSPSIPYEASVVEIAEFVNIVDGAHEAFKLKFMDSIPCTKQTIIWGFCDGSSIFISRSPKFRKRNVYDRIIFLGRYIYYRSTESRGGGMAPMMTPMAGGAGMMAGGVGGGSVFTECMIDANTGYEEQLTKEVIWDLIADDKELSLAFEKEKRKRKVLGEYVMKYAARHHDEIK